MLLMLRSSNGIEYSLSNYIVIPLRSITVTVIVEDPLRPSLSTAVHLKMNVPVALYITLYLLLPLRWMRTISVRLQTVAIFHNSKFVLLMLS